ncbi:MAG: outer membrane protein assembly factor BamA [Brumimicrobium sp.]
MRQLFSIFVSLILVHFSIAQPLDYENPKEYEIGPIQVNGADNFDHQAIKLIAGFRQGDKITIPGEKMTKAIRNLWEEELFSNVEIKLDKVVGKVAYISINLAPRPKLSRFKFEGINKRDADKIREEIKLFSGKNITENLIFDTRSKVIGFYREKGYYSVDVDIERVNDSLMNNSEIFIIHIDKKKKVKIGEINFYGVESVKEGKLRRKMKDTKQKAFWRFFKRSKFSTSAFKRDKEAMMAEFHKIGLRDAEIVSDSVYLIDEKNLAIDIYIDEGEEYYFGDIKWVGNAKYTSGYLDTVLGIERGDLYNQELLETRLFQSMDGRDITSLYMDRGHLFFQVTPVETNVDNNHIDYEMRIVEGKEARVKNIIIKGNYKTNEHVIRREIRTKPGDLFNRNDIIRTQRELAQLGYFDEQSFQINPIPNPEDGTVDIEYIVEEKSSDQIELSGGYGAGNLIGTLGLTFNNFSAQNIFKKSAWQPLPAGDGQTLSIRAQTNGRFYQSYNFSFTEPWLGGKKPNALSVWMNHSQFGNNFKRNDPGYSGVSITGVGVGMQRRKKIPDDFFSAYYELSYNYYDVTDYGDVFDFDNGYSNNIAFTYKLSRNSVDAPIYPKSGSKISFTTKATLPYSQFDGISDYSGVDEQTRNKYAEYYKLKLTGEWYLPLTPDKKLVLMPKIGFGFMGSYSAEKGLTPFERFYLGGNALTGVARLDGRELISLRGYEEQAVSSSLGDPIITRYTLELRYPISLNPSATFFVLGFAEAGNTYPSFESFNPFNVKRSVGGGVRVFLPMFGLLGFDYGWGIDTFDPHSSGFGSGNDITRMGGKPVGTFQFIIGANLGDL